MDFTDENFGGSDEVKHSIDGLTYEQLAQQHQALHQRYSALTGHLSGHKDHIQRLQDLLRTRDEECKVLRAEYLQYISEQREIMASVYEEADRRLQQREAYWRDQMEKVQSQLMMKNQADVEALRQDIASTRRSHEEEIIQTLCRCLQPVAAYAQRQETSFLVAEIVSEEETERRRILQYEAMMVGGDGTTSTSIIAVFHEEILGRLAIVRARDSELVFDLLVNHELALREKHLLMQNTCRDELVSAFFDFIFITRPSRVFTVPEHPVNDQHFVSSGVLFNIVPKAQNIIITHFQCVTDEGVDKDPLDSCQNASIELFYKAGSFMDGKENDRSTWRRVSGLMQRNFTVGGTFLLPADNLRLCVGQQYAFFIRVDQRKILNFTRRVVYEMSENMTYSPTDVVYEDDYISISGSRWCARTSQFCRFAPGNRDVFSGSIMYYAV